MEKFSYFNIFETKGIEYIAIILFFIILIPFWMFLNRPFKVTQKIKKGLGYLSSCLQRIPQGIFLNKNHSWAYLEKSGAARVGLDDLLLHITGTVKIKHLKSPGEVIRKGDKLAEIEHEGKVLSVYSPLSGTVLDKNLNIEGVPGLINEDPYGKGWMVKIQPSDWLGETQTFYLAGAATDWSRKEIDRFKEFLAKSVRNYAPEPSALVLQDGGEIYENALSEMPKEAWQDFQEEFLSVS